MKARLTRLAHLAPHRATVPAAMTPFVFACLLPAVLAAGPPKQPLPPAGFDIVRGPGDPARPIRPYGDLYLGPIIDTHAHLFDLRNRLNLDDVLDEMTKAGVVRLIVLPTPNDGRFRNLHENAEARRRFVRLAGPRGARLCGSTYFTAWMHEAYRSGYEEKDLAERLARLERDLDQGGCSGIGEIGPYHFEKHEGQMILTFPMNFEPMVRLAQLAARKGVWLDLHAEPIARTGESYEDQVFGGIAWLFRRAPGLKLILSHTGMTNPGNARAMLEKYPDMMMNLKIAAPGKDLAWDNLGPIVNRDKGLFEDWAALMEAMPQRFMIGIDSRMGSRRYPPGKYQRRVWKIRQLLGALNPAAAEMVAWRNAERLWPGAPVSAFANTVPFADKAEKLKRHRRGGGSGRRRRE